MLRLSFTVYELMRLDECSQSGRNKHATEHYSTAGECNLQGKTDLLSGYTLDLV